MGRGAKTEKNNTLMSKMRKTVLTKFTKFNKGKYK